MNNITPHIIIALFGFILCFRWGYKIGRDEWRKNYDDCMRAKTASIKKIPLPEKFQVQGLNLETGEYEDVFTMGNTVAPNDFIAYVFKENKK